MHFWAQFQLVQSSHFNKYAVSSSLLGIIYTNMLSYYIKRIWSFCVTTMFPVITIKKIVYT